MKKFLATLLLALAVYLPAASASAAVDFPGTAGHYLQVTAGLPSEDPLAFSFWVRVNSAPGLAQAFGTYTDASGNRLVRIAVNTANPPLLWLNVTGITSVTGSPLTVGTWYFVAFRRSGTTYEVYLDGGASPDIATTGTETAGAGSRWTLGADHSTSQPCDCSMAALKAWNADVSGAELANERWGYRPRRTAGLYQTVPLFRFDDVDYSGNGNNFTVTGSPTTVDGPPISW